MVSFPKRENANKDLATRKTASALTTLESFIFFGRSSFKTNLKNTAAVRGKSEQLHLRCFKS